MSRHTHRLLPPSAQPLLSSHERARPSQSSPFWTLRLLCGLLALLPLLACSLAPPPDPTHPEECGAPLRQRSTPSHAPHLGVHVAAATCAAGTKFPSVGGFSRGVEGYPGYVGQSTCNSTAKPGVVAFKDLLLATYPCTASYGIVRGCSVGGKSEHKEGRAFDWGVSAFTQKHVADALIQWLLATDSQGNKHAMARRLGIMYMVWNRRIWRAYRSPDTWSSYTGSNPHTDHVHFSFSWDGANKVTSFWTGANNVCSSTQTNNCAKFGCQCVGGNCNGGYCPGSGCTEKETSDCGKFGCTCVDHKCNGGFCPGSGCTAKEITDCGKFGCNCAEHKCSGGFCAGSGCTAKELTDCQKKGCGCVDHKCSGGSCAGSGCTAKLDTDCQKKGCTCKDMKCVCCVKTAEVCDGKDNDCDGQIDEGVSRTCKTACGSGKQTCKAGRWGACSAPKPATETCDGKDNDCDGETDEGCQCKDGESRSCGKNTGECKTGTQSCKAGKWGSCTGHIAPTTEVCDGKDNDCDGTVDDGDLSGTACTDAKGKAGTQQCRNGQLTCVAFPPEPNGPEPTGPEPVTSDASTPEPSPGQEGPKVQPCGPQDPLCPDTAPQPKKPLGQPCTDSAECESNLCVSLEGSSLCAKPCSASSECPDGFLCKDEKACWPREQVVILEGVENLKACQLHSECPAGQECDQGFCFPASLKPKGCGCQSTSPPSLPLWLLPLLLLALHHRKRPHF